MAITRVQSAKTVTGSVSTVSCSYTSTTTAGNFLVAVLSQFGQDSTGHSNVDPTTPAGWTKLTSDTGKQLYVYYRENAPATSSVSFTVTSLDIQVLVIAEYSGVATSSSTDQNAVVSDHAASTSAGTGSITTTNANNLLIASIVQHKSGATDTGAASFSSPTNSFTVVQQGGTDTNGGTVFEITQTALLDQLVSSTGTYSTAVTSTKSYIYSSIIAGFKASSGNTYNETMSGGANGGGADLDTAIFNPSVTPAGCQAAGAATSTEVYNSATPSPAGVLGAGDANAGFIYFYVMGGGPGVGSNQPFVTISGTVVLQQTFGPPVSTDGPLGGGADIDTAIFSPTVVPAGVLAGGSADDSANFAPRHNLLLYGAGQ